MTVGGRLEPCDAQYSASRRSLAGERLGRSADAGWRSRREAARAAGGAAARSPLLLLEHEPVFTLGRNADAADVLLAAERRRALGIEVFESDRGGKVTYHGPGQLVGYPILNLVADRRDVKRLRHGPRGGAHPHARRPRDPRPSARRGKERVTSVWVGNDKIAAIGVHLSRWVTTHGFALNVTDEPLRDFGGHRALRDHGRRRDVDRARPRPAPLALEEIAARAAAATSPRFSAAR